MVLGSLVGHSLGYRWAVSDVHERTELLDASGHGYLAYTSLVVAVALTLVGAALFSRARAAARGHRWSAAPPWLFALLPPITFAVQEYAERLYSGDVALSGADGRAVLIGLLLQVPIALVALSLAWALARTADAVGRALAESPGDRIADFLLPRTAQSLSRPRLSIAARGWSERGPPTRRF